MRERLDGYIRHMQNVTDKSLSKEDKEAVLRDFLIQIKFFQHERLIHLLVTLAFAAMALITVLANLFSQNILMGIFSLGMMLMLFFYVNHYFFLERGVQKLYTYYDKLISMDLDD